LENEKKALKSLEFCSMATQASDESGLIVDGNRWNGYCWYINWLFLWYNILRDCVSRASHCQRKMLWKSLSCGGTLTTRTADDKNVNFNRGRIYRDNETEVGIAIKPGRPDNRQRRRHHGNGCRWQHAVFRPTSLWRHVAPELAANSSPHYCHHCP